MRYVLLAEGNIALLRGHLKKALSYMEGADTYGATLGKTLMGEIQEARGNIDDAREALEQSYIKKPDVYTLTQIIELYQNTGDFQKAQEYINIGIREHFDMATCVVTNLLLEQKYRPAFEELFHILLSE